MSKFVSVVKSPEEFFNELVERVSEDKTTSLNDQLKFYLVSLLSENIKPEMLLKKNEKHPYADEPLAIIFQQSQLELDEKRKQMLKYVGDYSLYVAGFFQESLNRKIVSPDYYVCIGGQAFNVLSSISKQKNLSQLYYDIFNNFVDLLFMLRNISKITAPINNQYVLKLQ